MKVILVRHGETEWNSIGKIQGHTDIPLNEKGCKTAREVGQHLVGFKFDRIYSSPLKRAMETAQLMFDVDKSELITDRRLMEMNYGAAEGKYLAIVTKIPFFKIYNYFHKPEKYIPSGNGETFEEFRARIMDFFENEIIPLERTLDTVVITAHGAFIREVIMWINQIPRNDLWYGILPENCSLTTVELKNGRFKVIDISKIPDN